jgi:broad specificity phosphatase PhoE
MVTQIVFETHSISEDNDRGVASGWRESRLSARGRLLARRLGERRCADGIQAVFTSDLRRAAETARIAFEGSSMPILYDWRLRECDYGEKSGRPATEVHRDRRRFLDEPYPPVVRVGGRPYTGWGAYSGISRCTGRARECSSSVTLLPDLRSTICSMELPSRISWTLTSDGARAGNTVWSGETGSQ